MSNNNSKFDPADTAQELVESIVDGATKGAKKVAQALSKGLQDALDLENVGTLAGEAMIDALSETITNGGTVLKSAADTINDDLLQSEETYLSEKKRLDEEYHQRIYQEKLRNAKTWAAAEKIRRDEQIRLEKAASDEYLSDLKQTADREREILEQRKREIIALYTKIAQEAGKKFDEIQKLQDDLEKRLKNFGKLFVAGTNKFVDAGPGGIDLVYDYTKLRDLSQDIKALEKYKEDLLAIRERGSDLDPQVMDSFFDMIRQMPVEDAMRFTQELLGASDEDFEKYINDWGKKQKLAGDIAKDLYKEETDEAVKYMKEQFESVGLELPDGFFDSGEAAAQNFADGFVSQVDSAFDKIKTAIQVGMQSVMPALDINTQGRQGTDTATTTVYNQPVYNLMPGGESTAQQLQAIQDAEILNALRNS